jgi:hypothetical protein
VKWRSSIAAVVGVLILIPAFTNPRQEAHLKAIQEAVTLRTHDSSIAPLLPRVDYHNYFVCSTTTWDGIVTYGFAGKVYTTKNLGWLVDPGPLHD